MRRIALCCVLILGGTKFLGVDVFQPASAQPAEPVYYRFANILRPGLGESLAEGVARVVRSTAFTLQKFEESRVVFTTSVRRDFNESFSALDARSNFMMIIAACPNSRGVGAPAVSLSFLARLPPGTDQQEMSQQTQRLAAEVQMLLQSRPRRDPPTSVNVRPPRVTNTRGVVFEHLENNVEETVGFLNMPDGTLQVSWSLTNVAACSGR